MKHVSHQQVSQLLHNKFIVVLGDSIQRAVYKDLVLLLQKEKYLTTKQLKTKGEMSFEQDCLVEGGCLSQMHNGSDYKEVRQFQSAHHLVRFYFVTRIYSRYMQSILDDFQHGLKPDVVIVNSCVWDISRYSSRWINDYKENLDRFFDELRNMLPEETLVIWNLTMPLGERIKGGFLVPEIEHKASHLRFDVVEANFYSGTLADAYGMDVLDLHFQFRFSLQHRTKDGVHWNALTHRRITSLLLQHTAQAWGVIWPSALTSVDFENCPRPQKCRRKVVETSRRLGPLQPVLPVYRHPYEYMHDTHDYRSSYQPYKEHHPYVMRNRHNRHHYAPYTNQRAAQYSRHVYYY
ncbi:PC-esterase domain-containing protein 1A-like [Stegastes partitus]|uniref:PC-esterase domain-containing protein 1A-like n=1 Tax=Stegastes partitus TaxID=144197 RepID=A0A9Y4KGD7_9TELE|nr:PREDICTED: PC-esterase domain-containing protein 1A-like [Stegastes partitus]